MQVYMLLTHKCNLKCTMCIRGNNEDADVDCDELFNMPFIKELYDKDVVLTGGEPTLHPRFTDIVKKLSSFCKTINVTTNGIINNYVDEIKDIKNLRIQVSVDGDKLAHDRIRGIGTFEITMSTLKKLDKSGIYYQVSSVVGRKNQDTIHRLFLDLLPLRNLKKWRINYEQPFGHAEKENIMTDKEWNCFYENFYNRLSELLIDIQYVPSFELDISKMFEFDYENRNNNFNCGSGGDKIYIYPNYDVFPCTCLIDFCIGNLKKNKSLNEIVNGENNKVFCRYKVLSESPCNECEHKSDCNGGCIGMSYHYFQKLGIGDLRCQIFRSIYEKKDILL